MRVNADFSVRAVVHAAHVDWVASPIAGVERRMLDRIGDEVARATSIVRYAPASSFAPHVHTGGEEFLVLDGVFQDEHGDFAAGCYVRNPPDSSHTPRSAAGCVIFVKLWQFDPGDRAQVRIDTSEVAPIPDTGRPGVGVVPLFQDTREDVRLELWQAGAPVALEARSGLEILVIEGTFLESGEAFAPLSWLRLPAGSVLDARAGAEGARVWLKSGHLGETPRGPPIRGTHPARAAR